MAGHSKWANIKVRKGAQDKRRAKIFSRMVKEIIIAVKENGNNGDPSTNPALRNAIQNAKGVNLPKDNIERAIKKATGEDGGSYDQITFEGYGPNGVAFFVECATDNSNRTVANVRAIFNKHHGALGTNGSVEFLFERKGVFIIKRELLKSDPEEIELEFIDGGAESYEWDDDFLTVFTDFNDFGMMSKYLEENNIEVESSDLQRLPLNTVTLEGDDAKAILKMIDAFEDDDDVQQVFHTLEATDEVMQLMAEG